MMALLMRLPLVRCLGTDRRGAVALWMGLTTPVLIAAMGVGISVSDLAAIQVAAQRAADAAALAGALNYNQSNNAQTATTYAAEVAQINGITGSSSPNWNATSKVLTSNQITAQLTTSPQNSANTAVEVTVKRAVPLALASALGGASSVTVSASSWAALASTTTSTGPQPCIMALNTGITNSVTFSGSVSIDSSGCSIRSNSGVSFNGSVSVTTAGIYTATTISTSGSVSISGPQYQNQGTLADPYVNDTALQSALTTAASATGSSVSYSGSNNVTLNPGNYTGISVQGSTNVTMNPGLYVVNGNVSFAGSTNVTGKDVTIISTGYFDASGSSNVNITAATTSSASHGAIPGILFASKSSSTMSFTGSSNIPFAGLLYYPNGELDFKGSSSDGSSGCAEVIAGSIIFTGSVSTATNCSQYNTQVFGSVNQTSTTVSLVQ